MRVGTAARLVGLALTLALCGPSARAQEASTPAFGGATSVAPAAKIQVTGTLTITVSVSASASLPAGTLLNIGIQALVVDKVYSNAATANVTAKVTSGKATATVHVPYTWVVASTSDKVTITASVFGTATKGELNFQDSSILTKTIALPANGKTTAVTVSGTI
jgi:long-subunit fatty acid transport protein